MTRNRRFTRLVSWLLSVSMVASLVVVAPVVAAGSSGSTGSKYPALNAVTNKTVVTALEQMIDAGRIPDPANTTSAADVAYLDFSYNTAVMGAIRIGDELRELYPNLERVDLTGTNVWFADTTYVNELTGSRQEAGDIYVLADETFDGGYPNAAGNGSAWVEAAGSVAYRQSANDGSLALRDLLNVLHKQTTTSSTRLVESMLDLDGAGTVSGTITVDGSTYVRSIDSLDYEFDWAFMSQLSIGEHIFHLSFEVAHVDYNHYDENWTYGVFPAGAVSPMARLEVDVPVNVQRDGFLTLDPDQATATWGSDVAYTLGYVTEDGARTVPPGQLSNYTVTYTGNSYVEFSDLALTAQGLTFNAHIGPNANSGTVQVYYDGVLVGAGELTVNQNDAVTSLQLREYANNAVTNLTTDTRTESGEVYILAGAPISSLSRDNVLGASAPYVDETVYLLYDYTEMRYISPEYGDQVVVDNGTNGTEPSSVSYKLVTVSVPDPNNSSAMVDALGVVFTAKTMTTGAESIRVWVDNNTVDGTFDVAYDRQVTLEINVITNDRDALGYEFYAIPGTLANGTSGYPEIDLTQSELSANIAAGEYGEPVARFVRSGAGYAVETGFDALEMVQGDSVTLVAAAYYSEDGVRCVLGSSVGSTLIDWYDYVAGAGLDDVLPDNSSSAELTGLTGVSARKVPNSDAYTQGLYLQANAAADTAGEGQVALIAASASVVLPLTIRVIEEEVVDFIFVPEGYSLGSYTTYSEALEAETEAESGDLYRLNVLNEALEISIGTDTTVTVVAVTNHNTASADHEIQTGEWDTEIVDAAGRVVTALDMSTVSSGSGYFSFDEATTVGSQELPIVATSDGGLADANVGQSGAITLSYGQATDTLNLRLAPSQIVGIHLVLEDTLHNLYTPNTEGGAGVLAAAYPDEVGQLQANNLFQVPLGRGAQSRVYPVYAFSNAQFYGAGVSWWDYVIDTDNVVVTSSTVSGSSTPALNLAKVEGRVDLYAENAAVLSEQTLTVELMSGLQGALTAEALRDGHRHFIQNGLADIVANVQVMAAIAVGTSLAYGTTSTVVPINGTVNGQQGDIIDFVAGYLTSDGAAATAPAAGTAVPAAGNATNSGGLNAQVALVQQGGTGSVDVTELSALLTQQGTATMVVEYTYTINGKTGSILLGHAPSGSSLSTSMNDYTFDVVISQPDVDGFYLVATDGTTQVASQSPGDGSTTNTDIVVEYAQNETYRLYPVAMDGTFTLDETWTDVPASISYEDVVSGAHPSLSFLRNADFTLRSNALTFSNDGAIVEWQQLVDENGCIYLEMTILSRNEGNPYTVTLNPAQVQLNTSSATQYAGIATTNTYVAGITHAQDVGNSNVVDIVTTSDNTTLEVGDTVEMGIQYVVSSDSGNYRVNPTMFSGETESVLGSGANQLQVAVYRDNVPVTADVSYKRATNTLEISGLTPAGTYEIRLWTINKDGATAPIVGGYRSVIIEVRAQQLGNLSLRYGQSIDVRALVEEAGISYEGGLTYTEQSSTTSYLNTDRLSIGLATMETNTAGNTVVHIYEGADLLAQVNLTLLSSRLDTTNSRLSITTSHTNQQYMLANGDPIRLVWNLIYVDSSGLNPILVTAPIDGWRRQQADDDGLTIELDASTGYLSANSANGTEGMVVYTATCNYEDASLSPTTGTLVERFWAYISQTSDPDAQFYTYYFASDRTGTQIQDPLQLDAGDPARSIYAWYENWNNSSSGQALITSVTSGDPNVVTALVETENTGSGESSSYLRLLPVGAGSTTVSATVRAEGDGDTRTITLNVQVTDSHTRYSVSGTVRESAGNPVSNATVTLNGQNFTTNANGAYTIGNLTAGNYTLQVQASGYLPVSRPVSVMHSNVTGQDVTLQSGYALTGTVVDDRGNGLPGLTVDVVDDATGSIVDTAVTDGSGNFTATVGNGSYTVKVSGGTSYEDNNSTTVSISGENTAVGNIVMTPSSTNPPVGPGGGGGGTGGTNVTVSFNLNGGSGTGNYNTMTVLVGSSITLPAAPTREGYTFIGWSDGTTVITGSTYTVRGAVTLTAQWEENTEVDPEPTLPFVDVPSNEWYYSYIQFVTENGYMNGISDTVFGPNDLLTRAHMVQILYNMEGRPSVSGSNSFTDVPTSEWYASAVAWASENGLVMGYSDGSFLPTDNITREDLMVILYRYARFKGVDTTARADLNDYVDANQVSGYTQEMVAWAIAEGLVQGRGDGQLSPQGTATRAEMATFITRYVQGQ